MVSYNVIECTVRESIAVNYQNGGIMRNSDIVYNQIKELIITAELKPGQVIVDTELMERFKIGRTPIR